jgi:hypothetical protein
VDAHYPAAQAPPPQVGAEAALQQAAAEAIDLVWA